MKHCTIIGSLLSLALFLGVLTAPALAKRGPPPDAAPVVADGVRYQAVHDRYTANNAPAGLRAYVEAWDVKADKLLWNVKVYEIVYDQNLESDVQDIYIESLKMDGKILVATTERKKEYRVDIYGLLTKSINAIDKRSHRVI
jgi:hypothetical protein